MWITECKECGYIFSTGNKNKVIRDSKGNPYCCDSCKKRNEFICYGCHNKFSIDDKIEYKNELYCRKCYSKIKN